MIKSRLFGKICRSLLVGITFIAVLSPFAVRPDTALAVGESWLAGYSYRKEITINGTAAGAQTNYQLPLTVYRYLATKDIVAPTTNQVETYVYGILDNIMYWGSGYATTGVGYAYQTNLTTGVTTTLYGPSGDTGKGYGAWGSFIYGGYVWSFGQDYNPIPGWEQSMVARFSDGVMTRTYAAGTDNGNEFFVVDTDDTKYRVYRDTVDVSGLLGDVATYDDVGAGAGSITSGTVSATKGTSATYVRLLISGEGVIAGTTHTYTVKALSGATSSPDSDTDTGYWLPVGLNYQWQRSVADSDGGYASIVGGTTDLGASNVTTIADRGYMAESTPDATASARGKTIMRDMLPLAVVAGILVGIITAIRSGKFSLGKMLSHVMTGVIAFVLVWALLQALL
jgi:hypothetical protein